MQNIIAMIFAEVSAEAEDYHLLIKNIESKIEKKADGLELPPEKEEHMRELMLEILGMSEYDLFSIGFKYGVRMMVECGFKEL